MSTTITGCSTALVATPRPLVLTGARLHADDAQPRLENRSEMTAAMAWRPETGSMKRGSEAAGQHQDGRTAFTGATYVAITKQHSTRSGPPTSRPPA